MGIASPTIYHNTINNNGIDGYGISMSRDVEVMSPDIKYNIVTNFEYGIFETGGADPDLDYNDFYGNTINYDPDLTAGANSIDPPEDPLYVDAGTYDFKLQMTASTVSPCIHAAVTSSDTLEDLDGTLRPLGAAPDMGCYENGSAIGPGIYFVDSPEGSDTNDGLSDTSGVACLTPYI